MIMSSEIVYLFVHVGILIKVCLSKPGFLLVVVFSWSKLLDPGDIFLCLGRGELIENFTALLLHNSHNALLCTTCFSAYVFRPSFDKSNFHLFPCLIVDPQLLKKRELSDDLCETLERSCWFEVPSIELESLECLTWLARDDGLENLILLVLCQVEVFESDWLKASTSAEQRCKSLHICLSKLLTFPPGSLLVNTQKLQTSDKFTVIADSLQDFVPVDGLLAEARNLDLRELDTRLDDLDYKVSEDGPCLLNAVLCPLKDKAL